MEKLNKNSLVMFRNRTQHSFSPMRVYDVREENGQRELRLGDGLWWLEQNLMPYKEWKAGVESSRRIEDAKLVEIRSEDGAQKFKWNDNLLDVIWLTGCNRASNVEVGDAGVLEYRVGPSSGLYYFVKYKD